MRGERVASPATVKRHLFSRSKSESALRALRTASSTLAAESQSNRRRSASISAMFSTSRPATTAAVFSGSRPTLALIAGTSIWSYGILRSAGVSCRIQSVHAEYLM